MSNDAMLLIDSLASNLYPVRTDLTVQECYNGAGEKAQALGKVAAFAEDTGTFPTTHMAAYNLWKFQFLIHDLIPFFGFYWLQHPAYTHILIQLHTNK